MTTNVECGASPTKALLFSMGIYVIDDSMFPGVYSIIHEIATRNYEHTNQPAIQVTIHRWFSFHLHKDHSQQGNSGEWIRLWSLGAVSWFISDYDPPRCHQWPLWRNVHKQGSTVQMKLESLTLHFQNWEVCKY